MTWLGHLAPRINTFSTPPYSLFQPSEGLLEASERAFTKKGFHLVFTKNRLFDTPTMHSTQGSVTPQPCLSCAMGVGVTPLHSDGSVYTNCASRTMLLFFKYPLKLPSGYVCKVNMNHKWISGLHLNMYMLQTFCNLSKTETFLVPDVSGKGYLTCNSVVRGGFFVVSENRILAVRHCLYVAKIFE